MVAGLLGFCANSMAQVVVNLQVKPPFTPFISDYTRPERLEDISVSLFNQSSEELRLKFKLSLTNRAKGISISLKESVVPREPLVLGPNELNFVVLEDVSNLYGKLSQNSFNIQGADIQNLILDGTIPDGVYEICLQAFDYDALGFSKPLSGNSPSGCFSFEVNYTDPPTDIRLNNHLLQYRYGGDVPKVGINSAIGQNYSIQFTAPAFNMGSSYAYELLIFDETAVNPTRQQEANVLQAINTITPLVQKTSVVPFFSLEPGDIELDFYKNYYMVIRAVDENNRTLFKNKGYSAFKAFHLIDIQPIIHQAPVFTRPVCGSEVSNLISADRIEWDARTPDGLDKNFTKHIETRFRVMRYQKNVVPPSNILAVNLNAPHAGTLLFDTVVRYENADELFQKFIMTSKRGTAEENNQTSWVMAVQNRVFPGNPDAGHIQFINDGFAQCYMDIITGEQVPRLDFKLTHEYPLNNDTLPFFYVPVVISVKDMSFSDKVAFTQVNSRLELFESNRYLKLMTEPEINNEVNALGLDTLFGKVARLLNEAGVYQSEGFNSLANPLISEAIQILSNNKNKNSIQIEHALNARNLPLGNSAKGKLALLGNALNVESSAQMLGSHGLFSQLPELAEIIYLIPAKSNIIWSAKTGIYSNNPLMNGGLSLAQYEEKFRNHSFSEDDMRISMLKEKFGTFSGIYHVGMKKPVLKSVYAGRELPPGEVSLNFLPSAAPSKLLPPSDNNDAWRQFEKLQVGQQWNLEVSRDSNFTVLDTVISKRIVKSYAIATAQAEIMADLYTEVSAKVNLRVPGKYYWRVTWSNVTKDLNETFSDEETAYYRQLFELLGAAEAVSQEIDYERNTELFLTTRINYRYSNIDTFVISSGPEKVSEVVAPVFEVIYPLQDDTIPFMYPPVVVRNNRADTSYRFALSSFESPLEPYNNHSYFLLDTFHNSTRELMNLSYDSAKIRFRKGISAEVERFLLGADESYQEEIQADFQNTVTKKPFLEMMPALKSNLLVLGHSVYQKNAYMQMIMGRNTENQLTGSEVFNAPALSGLHYGVPYKDVTWNSRIAYYMPDSQTSVKLYDSMFLEGMLPPGVDLSPENTQGLAALNGNFHVGMKKPLITKKMQGAAVPRNQLKFTFIPSERPRLIFPQMDDNPAWDNWKYLTVAQQWNIEVSKSPGFDSLVFVYSECLIDSFEVKNDMFKAADLFYFEKVKLIQSQLAEGKYYYRITWSNPTAIDTNNRQHLNYARYQIGIATQQILTGAIEESSWINDFLSFSRINYRFSEVDSFFLLDSIAPPDSANCGYGCLVSMEEVSQRLSESDLKRGDEVQVGQFTMTITSVSKNGETYQGEGRIKCNLFPRPVGVTFTGLKVNERLRMLEGNVKGKTKSDDLLSGFDTGNELFDQIKDAVIKYGRDTIVSGMVLNERGTATHQKVIDLYNLINSPAVTLAEAAFAEEITMPFGLSKEVDQFPATIAITDISFGPVRAQINAATILPMNVGDIDQYFGLGARNLCLTPGGLADFSNGGELELMGDVLVPVGKQYKIKFKGTNPDSLHQRNTRVVWDCKGFKHLVVKVEVDVDTSVMKVPVDPTKDTVIFVKASGEATISSFNNFMISLQVNQPFELKALPEITINCPSITIDNSDASNPDAMNFPQNYQGERGNVWRGLYIPQLNVKLPAAFKDKNQPERRLEFSSNHMIIDPTGVTASLRGNNLLDINDGKMGGWAFSVDQVTLDIVQNLPQNFSLRGRIGAPVIEGNFDYNMLLSASRNFDTLNMLLNVETRGTISIPAWIAQLDINSGSKIEVKGNLKQSDSLSMLMKLNGTISIEADEIAGMKNVRFGSLPFEGLTLKTKGNNIDSFEFYLEKLGGLSVNRLVGGNIPAAPSNPDPAPAPDAPAAQVAGEQKAGGFPINIKFFGLDTRDKPLVFDLHGKREGKRTGIRFGLFVNVADAGGNAIGGQCNMGVYAFMPEVGENEEIQFLLGGLDVDTIKIEAKLSGVMTVKGGIAFIASDPVFGNGIAGGLMADIEPAFKVQMTGMFGEVDRMRYWMFGAKLGLNPGVPIDFGANVLFANSFSGEAWYKMERTSGDATSASSDFQIGKSPSGASFVPSSRVMFGFGVALGLTGPPGSPLFGDVGLYATINDQGALGKLQIEGNIWLPTANKSTAAVFINGNTTIDIDRNKLVGNMSALVNVAEGAVRGSSKDTTMSDGKKYYIAGTVDVLVDPDNDEWHIKIGNPFVNKGKIGLGFYAGQTKLFEAGGYFMMGNKLPRSLPPLDPVIVTKLRESGMAVPASRSGATGTGFAIFMGANAAVPEKKIELGLFYAGLSVQFAADGMLAPGLISCPGRDGINGWYMTGQAAAVVNGALGMHVETPFYQGDIIVAELNAGMLADAGLLNPYYFRGQFNANYSVLGGLIEGSEKFDFEYAEDDRCKPSIISSKARFGQIVIDAKPLQNESEVLVGVEPTIALGFPYNREIIYVLPKEVVVNGEKKILPDTQRIRLKSEYIRLYDHAQRYHRKVNILPSEDGLELTIRPDSFLRDRRTRHTLSARFFVERYNPGTRAWEMVKRANKTNWDTTLSLVFTTELEATLQPDYISHTTPRNGEQFFKKENLSKGKIIIKQADARNTFFTGTLATTSPMRDIQLVNGYNEYYGLWAKAGKPNETQRVSLTFVNNEVHFDLPANMNSSDLYQFRLIKERKEGTVKLQQRTVSSVGPTVQVVQNSPNIDPNQAMGSGEFSGEPDPNRSMNNTFTPQTPDLRNNSRTRAATYKADPRVLMFSFVFKASRYNTINEKIAQLGLQTTTYAFSQSTAVQVIASTNEPFEEFEVTPTSYDVPNGMVHVPAQLVISCSNNVNDDNPWMQNFYRPRVFRAGDTLQRKRSSLMPQPFRDITRQLNGVTLVMDEHVFKPIKGGNFTYDLRMADTRILNIQQNLNELSRLREQGLAVNNLDLNFELQVRLTVDPRTGAITTENVNNQLQSPLAPIKAPSASTKPANGTRLHMNYDHILLMVADFNRLKSLANNIVLTNPTGWMVGLTTNERALVTRVRKSDYLFSMPFDTDRFAIACHPRSNNTAPVRRLYINNNRKSISTMTQIVSPTNTTFSAFRL